MRCVKRILVKVFEDYNKSKLTDVLSIVDIFFLTLTVGELQDILYEMDTSAEKALYLISCQHFVKTNVDSD